MKNLVEKIEKTYSEFIEDVKKQSEHGNKSAGMRARKKSLELEKIMKEFRKQSVGFNA